MSNVSGKRTLVTQNVTLTLNSYKIGSIVRSMIESVYEENFGKRTGRSCVTSDCKLIIQKDD